MKQLLFALLIGILISSVGCNNRETNSNAPIYPHLANPASESIDYIPGFIPESMRVRTPDMTDSTWENYYLPLLVEAAQVSNEFLRFIENSDTLWSWVDSNVRQELNNWDSHIFYYVIVNKVCNRMLWYQLINNGAYSTEKKEALQYYTNLALQYRNPDAEMMAEALKILHGGGFWSTARVKSAADSASKAAGDYLLVASPSVCNCEDSLLSSYIGDISDAKTNKMLLIEDSQDVLDSLANL